MSSKERQVLERYANWHPNTQSLKSVDGECSGCGGCSGGGAGCGGGNCSGSCSQCTGCTNPFVPSKQHHPEIRRMARGRKYRIGA